MVPSKVKGEDIDTPRELGDLDLKTQVPTFSQKSKPVVFSMDFVVGQIYFTRSLDTVQTYSKTRVYSVILVKSAMSPNQFVQKSFPYKYY